MVSLLLMVALVGYAGPNQSAHNYAQAYQESIVQGKPLMVIVSAQWCPACVTLKDTTVKELEVTGQLNEVSYAVVDRDAEPQLAKQLMRGDKIPQIIVFAQSEPGRWERSQLTGYQSQAPIRSLIRSAVLALRRS